MYLHNKYTNWYKSIINRAKYRTTTAGYTETHHIIPKSLGGTDIKPNLVRLTAKEHFICHLLLTKMVEGESKKKMTFALWIMCNNQNKYQQRYRVTSSSYQRIREEFAIAISEKSKGVKKNYKSFLGRKHSQKTKDLQSKLKQGKLNPNYGKPLSQDAKHRISMAQKGISKPKFTCTKCGKVVGGFSNLLRWHNDQCRSV